MRLLKRLEALEKKLICEPTKLRLHDGNIGTIPGQGKYLLDLFMALGSEALSPRQEAQLDLIRRSVGGGPMIDVIRAMLHGPVDSAPEFSEAEWSRQKWAPAASGS